MLSRILLIGTGICLVIGCAGPPKRSPLLKQVPGIQATTAELRVVVRSLAPSFSGIIEEAADEVIAGAESAEAARIGLMWKTNGIPEMQRALFQTDPVAAIIDAWALTLQMKAYVESETGGQRLGPWQSVALRACERLEQGIEKTLLGVSDNTDLSRARESVREWTEKHPLDDTLVTRDSTAALFAQITTSTKLGGFKAVGSMVESMADLQSRLDLYNEYLPKLARWHAELLVVDLVDDPWLSGALVNLDDTGDSLREMARTVSGAEQLLAGERELLVETLASERRILLEFVERQRLETLAHLTRERVAVLEAIERMRSDTLTELDSQRHMATEDADRIGAGLLAGAMDEVEGVVDHFFLRAAQFTLALLILGAVALAVLRGRARR